MIENLMKPNVLEKLAVCLSVCLSVCLIVRLWEAFWGSTLSIPALVFSRKLPESQSIASHYKCQAGMPNQAYLLSPRGH